MFEITFQNLSNVPAGVLCLGVFEDKIYTPSTTKWNEKLNNALTQVIESSSFTGQLGQSLPFFSPSLSDFNKIILIGMGKKEQLTALQIQKIGGHLVSALADVCNNDIFFPIDELDNLSEEDTALYLATGLRLRSWKFKKYKTTKEEKEVKSKKISFLVSQPELAERSWKNELKVLEGVFLTRTVVSEPPNVIYPESLAEVAKTLKDVGVKVNIMGEKELQKIGMGSLLCVGQGSDRESHVVVMTWEGTHKSEAPLAFIGKGVTFDSGGISLKPANGMEDMKWDMAGAGAVIGLMHALAARKASVNAVGIVGLVENMPSGKAVRPSDVVTSLSGKTVEVINTDAEGRLVLADILWYAQEQFKPRLIVDLATLTGAIIISLGSERAGLFSNNDQLAEHLLSSGDKTNELLWRFPIDASYDKELDSDIADIKNIGNGRGAGSILAAKFLQRFIKDDVPWAHLDIAGVAWATKDLSLCAKGATAFGVRLLNQMVQDHYEQ